MRKVYGGTGSLVAPLPDGSSSRSPTALRDAVSVCNERRQSGDVPSPTNLMKFIRQIRLSVTVRSPDIDPNTKLNYRTTLTSTFSTRNTAYEKF
jgi:hypothetical protein